MRRVRWHRSAKRSGKVLLIGPVWLASWLKQILNLGTTEPRGIAWCYILFLLMWSNILSMLNSEMVDMHPQFPLLESFRDNKRRARLITEEGRVSVDDCLYVFYWFREYVLAGWDYYFCTIVVFHSDCPCSRSAPTTPWRGMSGTHRSYDVQGSCCSYSFLSYDMLISNFKSYDMSITKN
jgi:hypothetical protein